jgi:hypothetical protein
VVFNQKASGQYGPCRDVNRADAKIEHLLANTTSKMLVMPQAALLVTSLAAGQDHRLDLSRVV